MPGRVEIANLALAKLGPARIADLASDDPHAQAIRDVWDLVRMAELRAHAWRFAIARVELVHLTDEPPPPYTSVHLLPGNALRLLELRAGGRIVEDYTLEGRRVHATVPPPVAARLIVDRPDPGTWDPLFAEAIAARLAMELAQRLTQATSRYERAARDYELAIRRARATNAVEGPPRMVVWRSPWLEA